MDNLTNPSQRKNIVITGQTGAGKTSLAIQLAKKNNSCLLSADSRQIYNQMNIGTGKYDSPSELTQENSQWFLQKIPIYGINVVDPDQSYSAGDFAEYGKNILAHNSSVITIGGTGFYIKSLFHPDQTIDIPPNAKLREKYAKVEKQTTLEEFVKNLQSDLQEINKARLEQMNNSDRNNPRRLVRAIEVEAYNKQNNTKSQEHKVQENQALWIGLHAPQEFLQNRITQRVNKMIENGLEQEVQSLAQKYSWDTPGLQTIGYIEWKDYFNKKIDINTVIQNIITSHTQYARKQMIYLKRFEHINWIDISDQNYIEKALQYCNTD